MAATTRTEHEPASHGSTCFFETGPDEQAYLTEHLSGSTLHFEKGALTTAEQLPHWAKSVEVLSVFVHSHIGPDIIDALPNLKLIASRSTGVDHINVQAAESRGIAVANVPTYGENTVAEHTFALILSLSRKVHKAIVRAGSGNFSVEGLQGFDLKGKTIGVVGTGHIGLHVIRIAKGFGMNVVASDPFPNRIASEILGFTYVPLDELMSESDIVTLHAPLTPQNRNLIGMESIAKFKRGALLINTARGGLVDTQALLKALDDGILSGAGLDVIEGEEVFSEEKQMLGNPNITDEKLKTAVRNLSLLQRSDLVITPHIAFDSREAVERILNTTIENINAFHAGASQNLVHS